MVQEIKKAYFFIDCKSEHFKRMQTIIDEMPVLIADDGILDRKKSLKARQVFMESIVNVYIINAIIEGIKKSDITLPSENDEFKIYSECLQYQNWRELIKIILDNGLIKSPKEFQDELLEEYNIKLAIVIKDYKSITNKIFQSSLKSLHPEEKGTQLVKKTKTEK